MESVAFSGSLVPSAKSNVEKLDVVLEVELLVDVEDVVELVPADGDVELVEDVLVDVLVVNMVAAPAATRPSNDNPAPNKEPVSRIFIFATPVIYPLRVIHWG